MTPQELLRREAQQTFYINEYLAAADEVDAMAARIAALEAAARGVLEWKGRYGEIRDNDRSREAIAALAAALAPAPAPEDGR